MKFPKEFFSEEVRSGFTVPEMMKRAWSAELEVLEVIRDLCRSEGINWYAFYGTLLGAVRHKGFIPWDDDLDICMLREDYDRFLLAAEKGLPKGFVISGIYGSEPRLWKANMEPQGRVMADENVFLLPEYMTRFHAFPYMRIGIDIFPLDDYPSDKRKQYDLVKLCNDIHFVVANWDLLKKNGELPVRLERIRALTGLEEDGMDEDCIINELRLTADRLIADSEGGDEVFDVLYVKPPEKFEDYEGINGLKKEWFGAGKEAEFENTSVIIPDDPDSVLRVIFGEDYMEPKMFEAGHNYPFYSDQESAFVKMLADSGVTTPVDEFCVNWHKMIGWE